MLDRKTYFVDVIIPVPIRKEFTYRVPFDLNEYIFPGVRVVVPFGKSKLITGIITKVHENVPDAYQTRYIEHVLDDLAIITPKQYKFWQWISSYYMSPIGDIMNAALPSNFKLASETKILLHPDYSIDPKYLTERELQVVETLENRDELDLKELSELIGIKTIQPLIKSLIEKKAVITLEELNDKFTPKKNSYVFLSPEYLEEDNLQSLINSLESKNSSEKQLDALLKLLAEGKYDGTNCNPVEKRFFLNNNVSNSSLSTLEKKSIIHIERLEVSRFDDIDAAHSTISELSIAQKSAFNEIRSGFSDDKVVLLHGITGSGKTEIYVQLIQEQLDLGKQVLYLLPEIALTTQLISRLSAFFGEQIGVYHSKFNQNERVEIWNHVLQNDPEKFRIILGARSSVFLPFRNLGLVIVDEEHESTFKQYDPSPRYHARDSSIVLAQLHGANVLLGSATPSIESFYNAKTDKYKLVTLTERFGNVNLPEILCANVRKERKQGSMQSHFTSFLLENMREALNNGEQIILFQNRRGYTPMWMCEVCNWTPMCKNCDVSLTYHKHSNNLKCHYCSSVTNPVGTCGACGSNRLKMIGFGTEKIEDELSIMLPDKVIRRLDLDSTRNKNAYSNILEDFADRKIDILIGTQMVSKGLDFDNVNLVGILDADMMIHRPDFRALERSFQLMTQVAGRAGRRQKRGKVIIQTGDPDNWVIQRVHQHDYIGFYEDEIIERKQFFYPPFYKIISLTLKHRSEQDLDIAAGELAKRLREIFKERVLGPEYPIIKRIQNQYLKKITLKIEREGSDKRVKEHLQKTIDDFLSVPLYKSIRVVIDVDPA